VLHSDLRGFDGYVKQYTQLSLHLYFCLKTKFLTFKVWLVFPFAQLYMFLSLVSTNRKVPDHRPCSALAGLI
jgi:hypothetical protein